VKPGAEPNQTRLPIGSSFGQKRRAAVSLITVTGGRPWRSSSVSRRPRRSVMPSAWK
jgi:hypothetical protein